jgi:CheY-like chemotaxis protein
MASRIQIGNLLVEAGIISVKTLERSLELQKGSGKRLGTLLREIGLVTEEEVLEALARQCNVRTVKNFAGQAFPKGLLDLIPAGMALDKLVFPLKQHRDMLAVATLDPFDSDTFKALADTTGMKIHIALATRDDIVAAIKKHYMIQRSPGCNRQTLLLIDPSPVVTKYLQTPLEKAGYEVCISHDGIDGLKMAYSRNPDLILCDLMIPRMDSYMFMYALKTHPATVNIPVILLSSKDTTEEEHRAHKAGFVDFIAKPAMPVRVLAGIKKALAQADSRNQASVNLPPSSQLWPARLQNPGYVSRMRHGRL